MSVYNKNEIPDDLQQYFVRAEIGLEETPEQYIAKLVEVFRCVRDVLADDGTLWVNIGDSYCSTAPGTTNAPQSKGSAAKPEQWANARPKTPDGMKPKDLMGIPWMLAFALRADGWYLRQEIIWHKPNPMPESVTDRCTKAHESLFLLSKSPRYYFDHEAVKEPAVAKSMSEMDGGAQRLADGTKANDGRFMAGELAVGPLLRNRRSVWSIATRPYKGAHFAVFPPDLVEPCILAGSRPGDVVLDCFMGSGTTAAVAIAHGRQFIGCELNPSYKPLQDERIAEARTARAEAAEAAELAARQIDLFA